MQAHQPYPFMTWERLQANYSDTWVLLLDPKSQPTGIHVDGWFVYADKDKLGVYEQAKQIEKADAIAVVYTGEINVGDDVVFCASI